MSGIYLPIEVAICTHKCPAIETRYNHKIFHIFPPDHNSFFFHQNLKISSLQKRAPEQNVVELDIAVIGLILASPLHEVDELGLAVDVHGGELVGVLGDKVLRVECLDTK